MNTPAESRPPARRKSVLSKSVLRKSVLQPAALPTSVPRTIGRLPLGAFLLLAGISHLTVSRMAFRAQVPPWLPLDTDFVVVASGIVEITLGLALILLARRRVLVGLVVAVFFLLILPGNISQLVTQTDSFGLNSDLSRGIRLLFQPILVIWALWSTGAWKSIRASRSG